MQKYLLGRLHHSQLDCFIVVILRQAVVFIVKCLSLLGCSVATDDTAVTTVWLAAVGRVVGFVFYLCHFVCLTAWLVD